ncbi:MAG: hypothetical protein WCK09_06125, partial [Bacteroidota bacterium]
MNKKSITTSKMHQPISGFWAFAFLVAIFLQANTPSFAATEWRVSGLSSTGGANSGVGISGTSYNGTPSKGLIFTAGESGQVIDAIGIRLIGVSPFNQSSTLKLTIASVNQTTNALTGALATDIVSFTSPPGSNFAASKEYTFGPASLVNISQLSLVAGTKYAMTVWGATTTIVTLANASPYSASVYTDSQTSGFTFVGLESAGNAFSSLNYYLAIGKNVANIPTITSFTPTLAGTGTTVTITGTNFTGATAVSFGGTAASSYNVVSATSITAVVAAGTTGTISATTPGGTATSTETFTFISCSNPTSGGTISTAQTICSGNSPGAFTSSAAATGYNGTLEYKWQSSIASSSTGFDDIASSNSATYAPGTLTATTWYKRLARVTCMSDWTGAAESNVLQITVNPVITGNTSGTAVSICNNTSTTLTGGTATGGSGSYIYLWESSADGSTGWAVATGTSDGANYTTATLTTSVWIRRTVTSGGCTDVAAGVMVTVQTTPTSGSIGTAQTICNNTAPASLTSEADGTGSGPISNEWQTNASGSYVNISGATLATYQPLALT